MRRQRGARFGAVARDDVERAFREPDLRGEFGDAQQRQAGVLGGLHHARVARGERRSDAAAEDLHRVVPRNDVPGDAVRFTHRQHRHSRLVRNGFSVQLVGGARVVLEVAGDRGGVGASLLQRLAGRARFELREFLVLRRHRRGELHQQATALRGRHPAPRSVERLAHRSARRGDRRIDVGGRAAGDPRERTAVGGIDDVDRLSGRRRDPSVADEVMRPLGRGRAAVHVCLRPKR
jgi:hypothetical protein